MLLRWAWRLVATLFLGVVLMSRPGVAAKIERFQDDQGTLHISNAAEGEPTKPGAAPAPNQPQVVQPVPQAVPVPAIPPPATPMPLPPVAAPPGTLEAHPPQPNEAQPNVGEPAVPPTESPAEQPASQNRDNQVGNLAEAVTSLSEERVRLPSSKVWEVPGPTRRPADNLATHRG